MGFCSEAEYRRFLDLCPRIERFIVDGGTQLIKFWLEVGKQEQKRRFQARIEDPLRQWKVEPDGSRILRALVRILEGTRRDVGGHRHG